MSNDVSSSAISPGVISAFAKRPSCFTVDSVLPVCQKRALHTKGNFGLSYFSSVDSVGNSVILTSRFEEALLS